MINSATEVFVKPKQGPRIWIWLLLVVVSTFVFTYLAISIGRGKHPLEVCLGVALLIALVWMNFVVPDKQVRSLIEGTVIATMTVGVITFAELSRGWVIGGAIEIIVIVWFSFIELTRLPRGLKTPTWTKADKSHA